MRGGRASRNTVKWLKLIPQFSATVPDDLIGAIWNRFGGQEGEVEAFLRLFYERPYCVAFARMPRDAMVSLLRAMTNRDSPGDVAHRVASLMAKPKASAEVVKLEREAFVRQVDKARGAQSPSLLVYSIYGVGEGLVSLIRLKDGSCGGATATQFVNTEFRLKVKRMYRSGLEAIDWLLQDVERWCNQRLLQGKTLSRARRMQLVKQQQKMEPEIRTRRRGELLDLGSIRDCSLWGDEFDVALGNLGGVVHYPLFPADLATQLEPFLCELKGVSRGLHLVTQDGIAALRQVLSSWREAAWSEDQRVFHPTEVAQQCLKAGDWYTFALGGMALHAPEMVGQLTGVEPVEVPKGAVLRMLRDRQLLVTGFGITAKFGPRPSKLPAPLGALPPFEGKPEDEGQAVVPHRDTIEIPSRDGRRRMQVPGQVVSTRDDGLIGHFMLAVGAIGRLVLLETMWIHDR